MSRILLSCTLLLLVCPAESFNVFPLNQRPATGSAVLSLRRNHFETFPRVRFGPRYAPPLRSSLMGGSGEPDEPQDMPLSFYRSDNGTRNSEFWDGDAAEEIDNQYFQIISTLTPGEMVGQFVKSASPRVQVTFVDSFISNL